MRCFACDGEVPLGSSDRVGFRDTCDACGADLHVCRNCAHHDPSAYNECREPGTERVSDRERGNRCDWFTAGEGGGGETAKRAQKARGDLESLFKKPS